MSWINGWWNPKNHQKFEMNQTPMTLDSKCEFFRVYQILLGSLLRSTWQWFQMKSVNIKYGHPGTLKNFQMDGCLVKASHLSCMSWFFVRHPTDSQRHFWLVRMWIGYQIMNGDFHHNRRFFSWIDYFKMIALEEVQHYNSYWTLTGVLSWKYHKPLKTAQTFTSLSGEFT